MSCIRRIGIVRILTAVMLVTLALAGRPTLAAPSQQAEQTVRMADDTFMPKTLTIPVGTRVTWPNAGQRPHTSTSDTNVWDSGNVNRGGSFSFTFTQAGTFPYYCKYHGVPGGLGMTGTIVVTAAQGEPAPTPTLTAPTPTTAAAAPPAPEGPLAPAPAPAPAAPPEPATALPQTAADNWQLPIVMLAAALLLLAVGTRLRRTRARR